MAFQQYEPKIKGLKLNTALTAFAVVLMALLGFMGKRISDRVDQTHDDVLVINNTMARKDEIFRLEKDIQDLRTKQTELQHNQDAMSLEIRRIRQLPKTP